MATVVDSGNAVVEAIRSITNNSRVRLAMLMGTKLESGWNAKAVGDGGKSFGPYQIHLPAHPSVTAAQAQDPAFSTRYMLKAYEAGVARVDTALWNSDPAMAAATAAFYAERPARMYPTQRIRSAWPSVQSVHGGGSAGDTGVDSLTSGIPSVGDMWDTIWTAISRFLYDTFGGVVNYVYFAMLYGAGGITIAVGMYLLYKDSTRVVPTVKNVASAYRIVTGR